MDKELRSLIIRSFGFDDAFAVFDSFYNQEANRGFQSFPPYNIINYGDNKSRLEMALAGYDKNQLEVFLENNALIIKGNNETPKDDKVETYVYKGIAKRSFTTKFAVSNGTVIEKAEFINGLLTIDLCLANKVKTQRIEIK